MDSVTAINVVRDTLRDNLTDPRTTAGDSKVRTWIHTDEPLSHATFPRIQIEKADNPTVPIGIGSSYPEYEELYLNVWFYSRKPFKITVAGTEYANEQLVEYYLGQIKQTLKAQFNTMFNQSVKGYKHVNTTRVQYDPDTQQHYAAVVCRVFYFNGCE